MLKINVPELVANAEVMLADLVRRRAELNAAIKSICSIYSLPLPPDPDNTTPDSSPSGGGGNGGNGGTIAPDAYLGMSIPDAAKKHLLAVRKRLSTQDMVDALEAGGLPRSTYQTVYGVLRRREKQVGDIVNYKGDWGLAEWFPGYRKPQSWKGKKGTDEIEQLPVEDQSAPEEETAPEEEKATA